MYNKIMDESFTPDQHLFVHDMPQPSATAVGTMQASYNAVFNAMESSPLFSAAEKKAVAEIKSDHSYSYDSPSSCGKCISYDFVKPGAPPVISVKPIFSALPEELETLGPNYAFIAAHEVGHAVMHHSVKTCKMNSAAPHVAFKAFQAGLNGFIGGLDVMMNDAKGILPNGKAGQFAKEAVDGVRYLVTAPFRVASCLVAAIRCSFSRAEEKEADKFAMRAFPDKDLASYGKEFAATKEIINKALPLEFSNNKADTAVGAWAEKRLAYLTDYQNKLRAKNGM